MPPGQYRPAHCSRSSVDSGFALLISAAVPLAPAQDTYRYSTTGVTRRTQQSHADSYIFTRITGQTNCGTYQLLTILVHRGMRMKCPPANFIRSLASSVCAYKTSQDWTQLLPAPHSISSNSLCEKKGENQKIEERERREVLSNRCAPQKSDRPPGRYCRIIYIDMHILICVYIDICECYALLSPNLLRLWAAGWGRAAGGEGGGRGGAVPCCWFGVCVQRRGCGTGGVRVVLVGGGVSGWVG
eukprot:COSAG02_NODE_5822_length_4016_cov_7.403321_2_plen_243_part_00